MGLNVGANVLTSGGLALSMVLLLVTGILLVSASNKLKQLPEYDSSKDLKNAYNNLKTAYWLFFIATGISLILGVLYAGHETAWCPSEWAHGLVYLLLYVAVIAGFIFAYIALNNIYKPEFENNNGSSAFIWAALLVGSFAFMVMTATGSGRIGMNVTRGALTHRVRHAEHKLHEAHSAVTGLPNDFSGHYDRCESEHGQQVLMAPVEAAPMPPVSAYQEKPMYPVQGYQAPTQSFVGAPTVTRHSVVTTSQPVVTTSSPRTSAQPMAARPMAVRPMQSQPMSALAQSVEESNAGFI